MTEHVCEWELKAYLYVGVPIFGCKIKGCHEKLAVRQAEARLNEYETMKVTTERLRKRFELIRETVNTPDGKMTVLELFTQPDRACNDTLEGQHD